MYFFDIGFPVALLSDLDKSLIGDLLKPPLTVWFISALAEVAFYGLPNYMDSTL